VTATIAIGCGVYARRMKDIRARIRVSAADDGLAKVWNLLSTLLKTSLVETFYVWLVFWFLYY
jgi:hypothetical protein